MGRIWVHKASSTSAQMMAPNQRFSQGLHKDFTKLKPIWRIKTYPLDKGETDVLPCHFCISVCL